MSDDLRDAIASGYYAPGQQLPSVSALMQRYGVARQTVQNVVGRLRTEGLIVGRVGAGLFVREQPQREAATRHQATDAEREHGFVTERVTSRAATRDEAERLGMTPGQPVLVVTRTDGDAASNTLVLPADRAELIYELPVR